MGNRYCLSGFYCRYDLLSLLYRQIYLIYISDSGYGEQSLSGIVFVTFVYIFVTFLFILGRLRLVEIFFY